MGATFSTDCAAATVPFPHFWELCVGSDHAPVALRADWQAQLLRCRDDLGFRYVRFHGILSDDMGTLVNQNDRLVYSFYNADTVFDFLVSAGMKPFVELSFMPLALSSGPDFVFRYKANVTPPRDYDQWGTLISKLVAHWVNRYGLEEVSTWFFEVWNEPNLKAFWTGTQADYFRLYEVTARAIKAISPELKVGGPATAANGWIADFISFCEAHGVPNDFISTHHYPTDAFGKPGDDTETQLAASRIGVLREQAAAVRGQAAGRPVYYTEWSTSSNSRDPLHDHPYAAAYAVKTILDMGDLVQGYSYWAFSDIFAENFFSSVPFHGGFGLMSIYGIPKPAYRAFEILHRLGGRMHPMQGAHETVSAWMVSGEDRSTVVITNLALPRHPIAAETVRIELENSPAWREAQVARIDAGHANATAAWQAMASPGYPTQAQVAELIAQSELLWTPQPVTSQDGTASLAVEVQPQSVTAIELLR
ncbi:cellulase family glycosylhydrolase [Paracoccus sp. S-4012]|uniref:GH39 family glycosyl hydrolase n=1 Tax=Paracoccus sp. S-4012 TaxID=2665648 RepID=UPI0012B121D8|nr:cellulase family glycosylhydrolase [Paracoccus sp. S-4012]MRX49938.1 cellulase family glycosylhydrolase [Paracoccus sp. S-4012]